MIVKLLWHDPQGPLVGAAAANRQNAGVQTKLRLIEERHAKKKNERFFAFRWT